MLETDIKDSLHHTDHVASVLSIIDGALLTPVERELKTAAGQTDLARPSTEHLAPHHNLLLGSVYLGSLEPKLPRL